MAKDWKTVVQELAQQVEGWVSNDLASNRALVVHELTMDPTPDEPLLEIDVDHDEVLRLEPAAFAAGKLPTTVYLYAYPTLRRALLVGPDSHSNWDIQSSEGVHMNYQWNSNGFMELVKALSGAHVPRGV
jgi:hypothetical protein